MKSELEEAAENYEDIFKIQNGSKAAHFIKGAEWAAEKMFNEMDNFISWIDEKEIPRKNGQWIMYFNGKDNYMTTRELFEKYKKK
jgi:hypothetical protein